MDVCKQNKPCYQCICYGSYNTGGKKYCKCGYYKPKKS